MRKIIFLVLILPNIVLAQPSALLKIDSSWIIDPKTKAGSTTRVQATQQNPLPFCFATAAAVLYDQTRCNIDSKDCKDTTSFLALASAGQGLEIDKLNPSNGGSPTKSLRYLLDNGSVSYNKCNYNQIYNTNQYAVYRLVNDLKLTQTKWQDYKERAKYLSNFYKFQFKSILKEVNPSITQQRVNNLLNSNFNLEKITASLLLNKDCFSFNEKDQRFIIKFTKIDSKDIKSAVNQISTLLKQKKPIIVNFCALQNTNDCANSSEIHSFVIVAQAKATHKYSLDKRTVYWVVNSWGEDWQQQNSDGWIYADKLLETITGELIWLEQK